ncbi:MAG: acetyl-CoA carboxylase biotin carboxyl carrier protein subunit [Dehalococcoidia bacterium]
MTEVKSPMAGSIWEIVVSVGDTVAAGDELIILESMKMEIPVEAPHAGSVTSIAVEPKTSVAEGDVLLTIS